MSSKSLLPAVGFCLLGLVFAHHPMLFSGMGRIQINHEDPRLINYLLEHGYQWLRGNPLHRDIWSPPFFYPAPNVLAFSDSLLSAGPLYWPWRMVGIPADTSFQIWMMTCFAINHLLAFALLRVVFGLNPIPAAMGAFLFSFGGSRVTDIGHPQLLPHFFSLMAIFAVARVVTARDLSWRWRAFCWMVAAFSVAAQLYASFYMGWFLILATALALFWGLLLRPTRGILVGMLWRDCTLILGASILAAIPTILLLARYLEVARVGGYRSFGEVFLAVPQLKSWLYMGPHSWLYGWMPRVPMFTDFGNLEAAHRIGVGWATSIVCLIGLILGRDRPSIRLLALTGLTLFALVTRIPRSVIEGFALASWMLCPVAFLGSRGRRAEQAFVVILFALLSWFFFPWMALLPVTVLLVLRSTLLRGLTDQARRKLDEPSAVAVCLFPAVTSFMDSPFTLVTALTVAFAVIMMHRRSGRRLVPWSPMVIVPAVIAPAILLLTTGELVLWNLVYAYVPGGAAIRVTSRCCLLLLLPLGVGFAVFWQSQEIRARRIVLIPLAILCLLEQGMTTTTFSKEYARRRIRAIAAHVRVGGATRAFFYSSARPGLPSWNDHVDAMWAGIASGVPTINGYSGQAPKGWNPLDDSAVRSEGEEARVRPVLLRWAEKMELQADRVDWILEHRDFASIPLGPARGAEAGRRISP